MNTGDRRSDADSDPLVLWPYWGCTGKRDNARGVSKGPSSLLKVLLSNTILKPFGSEHTLNLLQNLSESRDSACNPKPSLLI